jgi:hypothetical protein
VAILQSGTDLEPLVTAAGGGDAQAFASLVDYTSGLVTSIVLAVLRLAGSAETTEPSELPAMAAADRPQSLAPRPAFTHPRPPLRGAGRR